MSSRKRNLKRNLKLLWINSFSLASVLNWIGIMIFMGYLFFEGLILQKQDINKAETGKVLVISSIFMSLSGLAIAIKRRTVNSTGSRVIRGKKAVSTGIFSFICGLLMALLIYWGIVIN